MFENFVYSFNIIAPIFIIVVIGAVLKRINFVNDGFLSVCDKLVFKLCLPCLIFVDIATANIAESLDLKLILFIITGVVLSAVLPCLILPIFVKDKGKCGAFAQGVFRSNSAILGLTLADSMFGDAGTTVLAMALPFVVTLYNVFAVIILTVFAPEDKKMSPGKLAVHILKGIVKNPLIIAIVLALLWQLVPMSLPIALDKSLNYLADMAMPIALISLGAGFNASSLRGRLGLAVGSSVCKTVVLPACAVIAAALLGFRDVALGVVFILFGGPAAVSSYIMAKEMKNDHELAGQILLLSTFMSVFTLFFGILILKNTGLIQ